jgi:hypothetical protein
MVIVVEETGTGGIITLELSVGANLAIMDFATAEAIGACVGKLWDGTDCSDFEYSFFVNSHDRAAPNLKFEDFSCRL